MRRIVPTIKPKSLAKVENIKLCLDAHTKSLPNMDRKISWVSIKRANEVDHFFKKNLAFKVLLYLIEFHIFEYTVTLTIERINF